VATQNPDGTWALTDEDCVNIAAAAGWIEDTPEARAAYLAELTDITTDETGE
jgi:hypothetical protein